jgi:hypothetical protein
MMKVKASDMLSMLKRTRDDIPRHVKQQPRVQQYTDLNTPQSGEMSSLTRLDIMQPYIPPLNYAPNHTMIAQRRTIFTCYHTLSRIHKSSRALTHRGSTISAHESSRV